jgi:hypothetical protein
VRREIKDIDEVEHHRMMFDKTKSGGRGGYEPGFGRGGDSLLRGGR